MRGACPVAVQEGCVLGMTRNSIRKGVQSDTSEQRQMQVLVPEGPYGYMNSL